MPFIMIKHFKNLKNILATAGIALVGFTTSAQTIAITDYDQDNVTSGTYYNIGIEFTVGSQDIQVTELGAYDLGGDGLSAPTPVTVWDATQAIVAQATVPSGTSAPLENEMRYVSITPVTLTSGSTYRMTSYSNEGLIYSISGASSTSSPEITIIQGCYTTSNSYPITTVPTRDYYGAHFKFNTTITILGNAAVTDIDYSNSSAGTTYEMGIEFSISSPITVTSLGAYDMNADGLAANTPVNIWNSSGTSIVSATIPSGTSAILENDFRYVNITPFVLAPGTYRMSSYQNDGYAWSTSGGTSTSAGQITLGDSYYNIGTAGYPTTQHTANDLYGANFHFFNSAASAAFLTYDELSNTTGTWEIGNIFTVGAQDILVTSLGAYDRFSDGLSGSTPVTIWNSGGGVVAQVTVPAGTAAPLINEMRYVGISPVVLTAGSTYRITSYGSEGFSYSNSAASGTEAAEISVLYGCYLQAGGAGFPVDDIPTRDYYGANFLFSSNICEAYSYANVTACDSAAINGNSYASSQTVVDVFTNGALSGCDSTHTTYLTIGLPVLSSSNMTVCNTATINGNTYTSSQTVVDVFTGGSSLGCDSTHTTYLVVGYPAFSSESITACGAVTVNGNSYSTSQVIMDTFIAASFAGCDSVHTTNFTLSTFALTNLSQTYCDSVMLFSNWYYASQTVYDTVVNGSINNCDSITAIAVTINNSTTDSIAYATCNSSYVVGGANQTSNGIYSDTYTGLNGCDSIVVTTLTLNASGTTYLVNEEICQGGSISVDTNTYTASGTYYDTIVLTGCDSIIITTLTVNSNSTTALTETINFGESFTVGTTIYNTTGIHSTTLNAGNGCDSIVTLNLTVLVGIATEYSNNITLYPNPTSGLLNLELTDLEGDVMKLVRVVDLNGKEMVSFTNVNLNDNNSQIDISDLSDGVYIVESTFESGSKSIVKVVKMK